MVLFAERGVKEGQEITWSYGDSYRSHRKEMGYTQGGDEGGSERNTTPASADGIREILRNDRRDEGGASVEIWMHIGKPK